MRPGDLYPTPQQHDPVWPWFLMLMVLSAVLLAGPLPMASAVEPSFTDNWVGSGDPCLPFKRTKAHLIKTGRAKARLVQFGQCIPVKFTVTWDITEVFRRHGGYGTDRARVVMEDSYVGYLEIFRRSSGKAKGTDSFKLVGPRPCCPAKKESMLLAGCTANFLVCRGGGQCRQQSSEDLHAPFILTPENQHGCEFEWFYLTPSTASGRCDSATVQIRKGAVKAPFRKRPGILDTSRGGSFALEVKADQSFTPEEIKRGLERGELTKTFTLRKRMDFPGRPQFRAENGTVTVKVEFGEQEDEIWLVRITAQETRKERQYLKVRTSGGKYLKLPVGVKYDWDLTGELVIKRSKQRWDYKEGRVKAATLSRSIKFKRTDLCECYIHKCKTKPASDADQLLNGYLAGRRVGGGVKLDWQPFKFKAQACVVCLPKGVYMPKKVFRHRFSAGDLLGALSKMVIPLKDGYTKRGTIGGLKYRITMRKKK